MLKRLVDTKFNALVRSRHGYMLYNKFDRYIGKAIEKYGEFSELESRIFRQLCRRGQVVFDVGANIGAHSLLFSKLVGPRGRVYAFEPQRIVFQSLCANLALNSIVNVETLNVGVSDEDGYTLLPDIIYDRPANYGGFELGKFSEGRQVKVIRLDDLLDIKRVDLIKVDVEGMEAAVLRGAQHLIETHKPILYVENDRLDKSPELIQLIMGYGYRLYWHLPPLYNPDNFANDDENIYKTLVSLNMLCVHRDKKQNIQGMKEIESADEHPLNKVQEG